MMMMMSKFRNAGIGQSKRIILRNGKRFRPFSSSPSGTESSFSCDIIQGPSLLRTSMSRRHRPSPSMLQLPGLRALPFWSQLDDKNKNHCTTRVAYNDPELSAAVEHLENNWQSVLEEYQQNSVKFKSDYQSDTEHSKLHEGNWDWHSYMLKGAIQGHFVQHYPITSVMLQTLRDEGLLFEGTPFGYSFFSTLHGNSRINAHTAPMNLRVRVHLALTVPDNKSQDNTKDTPSCGIRVGPITRTWKTGKALLLDDSYEHEVWNETDTTRILLLVDLWHPDVSRQERADIVGMFQHAQKQGWWSSK